MLRFFLDQKSSLEVVAGTASNHFEAHRVSSGVVDMGTQFFRKFATETVIWIDLQGLLYICNCVLKTAQVVIGSSSLSPEPPEVRVEGQRMIEVGQRVLKATHLS